MSSARNPTDGTLLMWLEGRPDKLERYLSTRPEASDRLEALTSLQSTLSQSLAEAVQPSDGMQERLAASLAGRPSGSDTAKVLLDLFGLGLRTAAVILNPGEATLSTEESNPT